MSQIKLYKYATWGLLFLNIAVLAFFTITKPKPRHQPSSNNFQFEVIDIFNLNSQQVATFKALAKDHNQKMRSLNEQQQKLLRPYFERPANPSIRMDEADALNQFQQMERQKIEVIYQHFQELESILNQDQLLLLAQFQI